MKLDILNFSVVVLAGENNPTILHPSFLAAQKIVPPDWPTVGDSISTPALSLVQFANGISITVESTKLQVSDSSPPSDVAKSEAPGVVTRYLKVLPHVRYTAVGLNFTGFIEWTVSDPRQMVIEKFLTAGEWRADKLSLRGMALELKYDVSDGVLKWTCTSGTAQPSSRSEPLHGIVITGNYHSPLPSQEFLDSAITRIGQCATRAAHFIDLTERFFKG